MTPKSFRTLTGRAFLWTALFVFAAATASLAETPQHSKLVYPGKDGRLVYEPYTDKGDRIPDFSNCGYKGADAPVPAVEVKETVQPGDGDDGERIQKAIDKVSAMKLDAPGIRGAVLLKKGTYQIEGTLKMASSGVVLRGEGDGTDGTVLVATGTGKRTLIAIGGEGTLTEVKDSRQEIADDYVPVGAKTFKVKDASKFKPGQSVIVFRPCTKEWIHAIGMDAMTGPTVKNWVPGDRDLFFDRVITSVKGNTITIDAPVVNAIQKEFGGGYVYRYDFPGRINNCGIENIRGESEYDATIKKGSAFVDEKHAWQFIAVQAAQNVWVRKVTSRYFGNTCVGTSRQAKWVTIENCACLDPVSQITGGRRYSFHVGGHLCLVKDCYSSEARHDFVMNANVSGPNVFLNCKAEKTHNTSEPHQRYATGTLYDNVSIQGNGWLQAVNRGNSGTGHGWAGAQMIFWNCKAPVIIVMKPPFAQNFIIGSTGVFNSPGLVKGAVNWVNGQSKSKFTVTGRHVGDGWIECSEAPVEPASLYLKQLEDRHALAAKSK